MKHAPAASVSRVLSAAATNVSRSAAQDPTWPQTADATRTENCAEKKQVTKFFCLAFYI
jgi:hypothetical protein